MRGILFEVHYFGVLIYSNYNTPYLGQVIASDVNNGGARRISAAVEDEDD